MRYSTAIKVAIECMERVKQRYAFDANIHKKLHDHGSHFVNAAKHYDRIDEAIKMLQEPISNGA